MVASPGPQRDPERLDPLYAQSNVLTFVTDRGRGNLSHSFQNVQIFQFCIGIKEPYL